MSPESPYTHRRTPVIYDGCLQLADWLLARSRLALPIAAAGALALVVTINQFVLRDFPNSGDEYVYLYQAQTLAGGRLVNAAPNQPRSFAFNYIVYDGDRAFGIFPIGWPLVQAGASSLGLPSWIVNPLLGTLSLFLIAGLGTRLHSARVGVLAALITGMTPFFLFNAASYFSHTLCSVLLLAAACISARENRAPLWVPLAVGFFLGWAVLTRYFAGIVCGVPVAVWLLRQGAPFVRTTVLVAAGGFPWAALLAAYNQVLMGSPWQLSTPSGTVSKWFADGFLMRGADILATHLLRFVLWTPPLLLVAYAAYLIAAPREVRRGALDWMPAATAVGLYFFIERGGNQYGPRFFYEAFPFLVIFVVANLFREPAFVEKSPGGRKIFVMVAASVAVLPVALAVHAIIEHRVVRERMDPFEMSAAANIEPALVFIDGRVGTTRSMAAADLTRNGIAHSGPVLFAIDLGTEEDCRTLAQHSGRAGYVYAWDVRTRSGTLRPISC